jgi:hypothetical protein
MQNFQSPANAKLSIEPASLDGVERTPPKNPKMHSPLARVSAVFAFAFSVLFGLTVLIALTTPVLTREPIVSAFGARIQKKWVFVCGITAEEIVSVRVGLTLPRHVAAASYSGLARESPYSTTQKEQLLIKFDLEAGE